MTRRLAAILCLALLTAADAPTERISYHVTGFFAKGREKALREAFAKVPDVRLAEVDFDRGEVTLEFAPAKVFPKARTDQVVAGLDNRLKTASGHTFGIKPRSTTPRETLERIEVPVAGLDCEGCSLAAYEAVSKIDGVEWAAVDFRAGRVMVLVDPEKADRARVEAALRKLGVELTSS